jgi:hypothetical protein
MNQWWIVGNAVTIMSGIACMVYLTHVLHVAGASCVRMISTPAQS